MKKGDLLMASKRLTALVWKGIIVEVKPMQKHNPGELRCN